MFVDIVIVKPDKFSKLVQIQWYYFLYFLSINKYVSKFWYLEWYLYKLLVLLKSLRIRETTLTLFVIALFFNQPSLTKQVIGYRLESKSNKPSTSLPELEKIFIIPWNLYSCHYVLQLSNMCFVHKHAKCTSGLSYVSFQTFSLLKWC